MPNLTDPQWARWQEQEEWIDDITRTDLGTWTPTQWGTLFAQWWDYVVYGYADGREHPANRPPL